MIGLTQFCDLCRKTILPGQKYGVITFNIETLLQTEEEPDGIAEVHHSEVVHTMCLECASKYNSQSIRELLD
ncbi:MAG: hypothetical protein IPL55_07885 [Saprospiraceae bacterium]|nr:hypothetical protein [Saprospiraceae bacterium]